MGRDLQQSRVQRGPGRPAPVTPAASPSRQRGSGMGAIRARRPAL